MEKTERKYELIGHSHQIADTGDYDGYYEITNGEVSILTQDDDDEALEEVVKALNNSGCKFYLDDSDRWEANHYKQEFERLEMYLEKKGFTYDDVLSETMGKEEEIKF